MRKILTSLRSALVGWIMTGVAAAYAGPMGFKDSTMAMGDFSPNWREAWVNHAVTARDAYGVGGIYMRSDDKRLSRTPHQRRTFASQLVVCRRRWTTHRQ